MNQQPAEKREPITPNSGGVLDVHSIFPTIQGEGPFTGQPAVFLRLAGCNLQCPLCDTDYTKGRHKMPVSGIIETIKQMASPRKLLVITGGEPFRQDLERLVRYAKAEGFTVQIETNGTLAPPASFPLHKVTVVCSPKAGKVAPSLIPHVAAWKYVLHADAVDTDGLPLRALDHPAAPRLARPPSSVPLTKIYVQPVDTGGPHDNQRHLECAIQSALKFGYTLCLQTHKILGLE